MKNPVVFLDISIDRQPAERILIELFADVAPIAAENFRALCTGEKGIGPITGKPLHYKGTEFTCIYDDLFAEGGDITHSKNRGNIGESIYDGGYFPNENCELAHSEAGLLSMVSTGPKNLNGSKFNIAFGELRYLYRHRCVFGKVIDGMETTVEKIKLMGEPTGEPIAPIVITDCGQIPEDEKHHLTESVKSVKKEIVERAKSSNSVLKFYYSKRKCWTYESDPYKVYFPPLEKIGEDTKKNVVCRDGCRPKSGSKFYSSTRKYWRSISESQFYSCQFDEKELYKGKKRVMSFDWQEENKKKREILLDREEEKKQRVNEKRRKHLRSNSATSFSEDVKYLPYESPRSVSVLYSSD